MESCNYISLQCSYLIYFHNVVSIEARAVLVNRSIQKEKEISHGTVRSPNIIIWLFRIVVFLSEVLVAVSVLLFERLF